MSTKYGLLPSDAISAGGLLGATAASRYAGATASGAPLSGTFAVGDYVVDQTGSFWICTVAGTPGTWTQVAAGGGGGGGAVSSVFGRTGAVVANNNDYKFSQVGAAQAVAATSTKNNANSAPGVTAYSAAIGDLVIVDTSGGNVGITLPTGSANDKGIVVVKLVTIAAGSSVTITASGSDVFNKSGGSASMSLSLLNQGATLQYSSSAGLWYVLGDDLPILSGQSFNVAVAPKIATLTDAATISLDASLGNHFRVTLSTGGGSTRVLGTPTNPTDGQRILLEVIQDSSGARALTYSAAYAFSTGIPQPTLTTTANKRDFIGFVYNSTASLWYCVAFVNGF